MQNSGTFIGIACVVVLAPHFARANPTCYFGPTGEYSETDITLTAEVFPQSEQHIEGSRVPVLGYGELVYDDMYVPAIRRANADIGTLSPRGAMYGVAGGCYWHLWQSPFTLGFSGSYMTGSLKDSQRQRWVFEDDTQMIQVGYRFSAEVQRTATVLAEVGYHPDHYSVDLGIGYEGVCGKLSAQVWANEYTATERTSGCSVAPTAQVRVQYDIKPWLSFDAWVRQTSYEALSHGESFGKATADMTRTSAGFGLFAGFKF